MALPRGGLGGSSPFPWGPCGARTRPRWALPALPLPFASRQLSCHSGAGPEGGAGGGRRGSPVGLYELLGVPASATQSQIKTAYYKQSFIYHPDRNAGSEEAAERFTRISEAYTVLGSVALRKKYDRGILSRQDLHTAGKPSGKEGAPAAPVSTPRRMQTFTSGPTPAKPVFDFDKFYQAHYNEQLERERFIREKQREIRQRREEAEKQWTFETMQELSLVLLFFSAMVILFRTK